MFTCLKNLLQVELKLLGLLLLSSAAIAVAQAAQAADVADLSAQAASTRLTNDVRGSGAFDQVTSVSQLSDVRPTDWAFQSLQSLVERYGCIIGYPDRKYRGNRALTRYEFAAGLNACLDRVNELIAAGTADLVKKEDLLVLQKLQEEFAAELATLRGRVDALEARTSTLERQQFSTTTKLSGEAIFNLSDIFGRQVEDFDNQFVFQDRVRLDLRTSFTGRDVLHTRLTAGNFEPFFVPPNTISPAIGNRGTAEGLPAFSVGARTQNSIDIDRLDYSFALSKHLDVYVAAAGGRSEFYVPSIINPFLGDQDGGRGAISTFGQQSPIYRIGGGAGAALNFSFDQNKKFVLTLGYLAGAASDPNAGRGLFSGEYAALGQLTFTPSDAFQIGLTYVNSYHPSGRSIFNLGADDNTFYTGTVAANALHTGLSTVLPDRGVGAVTNSYGVQASLKISPKFVINAFGGYTSLVLTRAGNGDIWYYGLGLAFPDLFKKGNLGGIVAGVEPYLGNVSVRGAIPTALGIPGSANLRDLNLGNSRSVHVEAFYRFQLTDNIAITPGVVWITNPDQDDRNDDFVIGTIRTTFSF